MSTIKLAFLCSAIDGMISLNFGCAKYLIILKFTQSVMQQTRVLLVSIFLVIIKEFIHMKVN